MFSWRVSCCDYRLWWWIFYSVILIGMMWMDLSLCNVICVDVLGQPFYAAPPRTLISSAWGRLPCPPLRFCLYDIAELKRMLGYLPIVLHVWSLLFICVYRHGRDRRYKETHPTVDSILSAMYQWMHCKDQKLKYNIIAGPLRQFWPSYIFYQYHLQCMHT